LCVTLVIYQESLHDARSTKYKMWTLYSKSSFVLTDTNFVYYTTVTRLNVTCKDCNLLCFYWNQNKRMKKKLTVPPLDVRCMQHVMRMVVSFHSKCESMKSQLRVYCKPIVLIPVLSVHLFPWWYLLLGTSDLVKHQSQLTAKFSAVDNIWVQVCDLT